MVYKVLKIENLKCCLYWLEPSKGISYHTEYTRDSSIDTTSLYNIIQWSVYFPSFLCLFGFLCVAPLVADFYHSLHLWFSILKWQCRYKRFKSDVNSNRQDMCGRCLAFDGFYMYKMNVTRDHIENFSIWLFGWIWNRRIVDLKCNKGA